jgi:hypothetical protein
MRSLKNLLLIVAVAISLTAVGCEDEPTANVAPTPGSDTLTGTLTASRTLDKDTLYTIKGTFLINPGVTLTIPAGTTIQGLYGTKAVLIAVSGNATQPSGKLIADGTKGAPIVFTSSRPVGQRARGDWAGVVLSGMADLNVPGKTGQGEGNSGSYGPGANAVNNTESSGILRYVRIEYAGSKVSSDNEVNGLTLNAVGSGTVLEYVQTHMIADDGFEWFGGTVTGKYLVSSGNDDDAFDMDFGYSGKLQFLFAIQDPTLANRGFEIDNDATGSSNPPFTSATVSNVTLVGTGQEKVSSENNDGLYLRRNNKLKIYNAIVTNFRYGLLIDGSGAFNNAKNGELLVKNSVLAGSKGAMAYVYSKKDPADISKTISVTNADTLQSVSANWNISTVPVTLTSISFDAPNPIPVAAPAVTPLMPPGETFFTQVSYIGAFGTENWLTGWTNFKKN